MIPALGERKEIYENLAQHLDTYKVICFDLPGHHQYIVEDFSIHSYIKNLHEQLTKLGIEKAHWMGNSIGAWVIQSYYTNYTKSVESLWLLDGGYFFKRHYNDESIVLPMTERYEDIVEAVETLAANLSDYDFFKRYFLHNFVQEQGYYKHHANEKVVNALAKEVDTIDFCADIFDIPVFLCISEEAYEDELTQIRVTAFEQKHQLKAVIIPNSQHLLPLTNSDDLAYLINTKNPLSL